MSSVLNNVHGSTFEIKLDKLQIFCWICRFHILLVLHILSLKSFRFLFIIHTLVTDVLCQGQTDLTLRMLNK